MSCSGNRTTPIVEVRLDHKIDYDDYSVPNEPFAISINLFLRVWKLEFDASFHPQRNRTHSFWLPEAGMFGVKGVGFADWSFNILDSHQDTGDYTEFVDAYRRERKKKKNQRARTP